ncbi:hypothetical protein LCG56_29395 (plasmid) [Pseudomonas cannabina pv. alisalensis]|uniref:Uncharacterized protein n=2 Tax=Pseudomonas syringae pv. maculicola TaxID=59511 RepID=Q6J2J3_PSEYM|nr:MULTISPECIES: hypothetical protein [Pseudomonas syringae group]AAT35128.1 hypothetical protein PMA4326A11 [Pseudomonas syringae pv. maculicola]QHF00790.1 hypothetical protein PMA4326_030200 [Pseudomonas syringae pv. maculicola str. ES4326]UBZ00711.1 hypothetical protein LCG56_29395 [Pseudomonas cannabina pv. alisalensis]
MQMSEVKQVKQVIGESNANARLKDGWTLLAVVSASLNNGSASAMYVLGKSGPVEQEPETDWKAMVGE